MIMEDEKIQMISHQTGGQGEPLFSCSIKVSKLEVQEELMFLFKSQVMQSGRMSSLLLAEWSNFCFMKAFKWLDYSQPYEGKAIVFTEFTAANVSLI